MEKSLKISLKAARINAKFEIGDVAELLGVSRRAVEYWEDGKHFPKAFVFMKLCELYKVKMDNIDIPES